MNVPPQLFDRAALARHRARAAASGPALFLHEAVADEIEDRLAEVNRSFIEPAVVTPWPGIWAQRLPGAAMSPDDETLSFQPDRHDLVIHALALHWANDPVGQLVQCRRALKPDGLLIAALFGGRTLQELRGCLTDAEARVTGGLSPRVTPMGEIRDLGGLLSRAGLSLPVADSNSIRVSYDTPFHLMRDLRAMGETNALCARLRHASAREMLAEAARLYAERHSEDDGRVIATFEVVTLTGWAPAPDQPRPLRPGSAKVRLADALGATETRLDPNEN
ncbi:methyltransferase domain-containing protein [Histidinibacterium lentulum]|uniref:Methyltransferase domain-containing protein n=1 Tax=Histidinibacterium lentulum TaxID=2480588 RepID=A0A3N2R6R0_9RHOB|nr:methyltransferase domain-containing protein [Histidinibacterium lentulum]ROU03088.1 methyltransferase domain-containing protein [Histidinibacterium lentulum]